MAKRKCKVEVVEQPAEMSLPEVAKEASKAPSSESNVNTQPAAQKSLRPLRKL